MGVAGIASASCIGPKVEAAVKRLFSLLIHFILGMDRFLLTQAGDPRKDPARKVRNVHPTQSHYQTTGP